MLELVALEDCEYPTEEISVTRYLCDTLPFVVRTRQEEQNLTISIFYTENLVEDRKIDKISLDTPEGCSDWQRENDDNDDAQNNGPFGQFVGDVINNDFASAKEKDRYGLVDKITQVVLVHCKTKNIEGIY